MEETWIIVAIVAVGVSLSGLVLTGQRATRAELVTLRAELVALRERMAHLEGLLEGLREAITGSRPAAERV